jgi:hypothetical protein
VITGKLDKDGTAHLDNLQPASAEVEFGEEPPDTQAIRNEIQNILNDIIKVEVQEAQEISARLAKKGIFGKYNEYQKARARGTWKAITNLLTFVSDLEDLLPQNHLKRALGAAWESWRYSDDGEYLENFQKNFSDAQFKELADVIGIDPRSITRKNLAEVKEMANFIWEDSETQNMLLTFAKDYIAAQHSLEIVEGASTFAADIAIGVIIAALTAGAGGAAVVVGKNLKHIKRLIRLLGIQLKRLARALKKIKGRKKVKTQTNGKADGKLEAPKNVEKNAGDSKKTDVPNAVVRQDNDFSAKTNAKGQKKSYLDEEGNLNPANPDGDITIQQHVRGSNPAKSNSQYTSTTAIDDSATSGAKKFGENSIGIDTKRLQKDIDAGKVKDVEVVTPQRVQTELQKNIDSAQSRYDTNPTKNNARRLEAAKRDLQNAIRDNECLVKGCVPSDYIQEGQ